MRADLGGGLRQHRARLVPADAVSLRRCPQALAPCPSQPEPLAISEPTARVGENDAATVSHRHPNLNE
jgi:hypothetical protein